jgi:hypothetical protein
MPAKKTAKPSGRTGPAAAGKPAAAKVGRGKPPQHTQFQKGKSGNPKGRPKGSQNLQTLIANAAYDQIVVTNPKTGEKRKLSRIEATIFQLANKSAQGDAGAMQKFLKWVDEMERRAAEARPAEMQIGDADLEVLKTVYDRMKLCEPPKAS